MTPTAQARSFLLLLVVVLASLVHPSHAIPFMNPAVTSRDVQTRGLRQENQRRTKERAPRVLTTSTSTKSSSTARTTTTTRTATTSSSSDKDNQDGSGNGNESVITSLYKATMTGGYIPIESTNGDSLLGRPFRFVSVYKAVFGTALLSFLVSNESDQDMKMKTKRH
eukprot:CAMPEP_0116559502 /NCGR_PEP_ID=MMETSP0397-20121206/10433_1 /TAXON_ID=216820 /ORGANISM="Cyclophora tenuis, Strain ECT3854" /LENGTH=166 /DNA_ID=CAMNT_0004085281 /DNA_START=20 /DNA_END=520 /DNA_ORIENTATION=+